MKALFIYAREETRNIIKSKAVCSKYQDSATRDYSQTSNPRQIQDTIDIINNNMKIKEAARHATAKYSSVAVIGGGIGGLSVANALLYKNNNKHRNIVDRVTVYEQADKFIPTAGAGFGFSPNGQMCLSSIGIHDYHNFCQPFDTMKRITADGTTVQQQASVFETIRNKYGFGFSGCLRADLVNLLVENLHQHEQGGNELVYSSRLTGITPHLDKVELQFHNNGRGTTEDVVDLVIGADGINSTVAKLLNIDDAHQPPIYSGANIFYGKIPNPDIDLSNHPVFDKSSVVNGPGSGEFIAFHAGRGNKRIFIWASTYAASHPPSDEEEWRQGNRNDLSSVLSKYPPSHPIHEFASLTGKDDLLHFGLYYRHHRKEWSRGRVVLLGDSCHATLPYVGQGANQAIEDSIYLADCLDKHDSYEDAYQDYYERRFPRTKRVVQLAGVMHKLYHSESWLMHKALDLFFDSVMRGGVVLKQLEREIINECPVSYEQVLSEMAERK